MLTTRNIFWKVTVKKLVSFLVVFAFSVFFFQFSLRSFSCNFVHLKLIFIHKLLLIHIISSVGKCFFVSFCLSLFFITFSNSASTMLPVVPSFINNVRFFNNNKNKICKKNPVHHLFHFIAILKISYKLMDKTADDARLVK